MLGKLLKTSTGKCSEVTNICAEKLPDVRSARGSVSAAATISSKLIALIVNYLKVQQKKRNGDILVMSIMKRKNYLT